MCSGKFSGNIQGDCFISFAVCGVAVDHTRVINSNIGAVLSKCKHVSHLDGFFLLRFPSSDSCLNLNFISQRARQPSAVRFDVQRLDDSILEHHRVALRAQPTQRRQIGTQFQLLGENGGRIGEHANLTAGVVLLAPGRHHERVVHGNAHDLGHAGRLEITGFVHITGQMGFGAAGGESSGHGKQNHLLAGAQIRNVDLVGRRILEQVDRWNFVTLLRGGVGEREALGASLLKEWVAYLLFMGRICIRNDY